MKRSHFLLWLLFVAAFCIVAAISLWSPVRIFGYEIKDSGLARLFAAVEEAMPDVDSVAVCEAVVDSVVADTASAAVVAEPDTMPKTILIIGDSMLEGLYPRLAAYADASGHTLYAVIWYSSTSEKWGKSARLKSYIERLHPDFIFMSLGSNELFVKDIANRRKEYVKKIVADIDTVPYLWIGPPNWKEDTGINALVADNVLPGCFFLSAGMEFSRKKDGAHPTSESAAEWMDSIVRWMPAHCRHKLRLDPPERRRGSAKKVYVHGPDDN